MKIAQIAPPWIAVPPKNYGGTELVIYNLTQELHAQGFDVTLFAPGDAKTSAKHISFIPSALLDEGVPWAAHLKAYYHLHKSLEHAGDFDVIHTHLSSPTDMYLFPLLAQLNTPHITTLHSNFPFDRVQEWVGDADQFFMEWAPQVPIVTVSERARANLPAQLNCVGVVHLGVDTTDVPLQETPQDSYFVWLGRFAPEKGPHHAIEAAKRARVPLILAGTIDTCTDRTIDYFYRVVEPLIDGVAVKYIGPINKEEKIKLLAHAAGFLNPIEWEEPGATAVLEAMGLGCPVISFNRGVASELIVDGVTGFLVRNVDEMAQAIRQIWEIDRSATQLHVQQNFSTSIMAKKYVKIYKEILAYPLKPPAPSDRVAYDSQWDTVPVS